jgi:hypothetical protein
LLGLSSPASGPASVEQSPIAPTPPPVGPAAARFAQDGDAFSADLWQRVLPDAADGLSALEQRLDGALLARLLAAPQSSDEVDVTLPRFRIAGATISLDHDDDTAHLASARPAPGGVLDRQPELARTDRPFALKASHRVTGTEPERERLGLDGSRQQGENPGEEKDD